MFSVVNISAMVISGGVISTHGDISPLNNLLFYNSVVCKVHSVSVLIEMAFRLIKNGAGS